MGNSGGRSSIIGGILTCCFTAIMMYVLFGVLMLMETSGGAARLVFSILNCLIIILFSFLGNLITKLTSAATTMQLWCITIFYTILQFAAVFIGINSWYGNKYVLYQLILFFLYLCIALPILNISYSKKNILSKET